MTQLNFMSATMEPREKLTKTGWRGEPQGGYLVKESKAVAEFLKNGLNYTIKQIWEWMTQVPGLDVTVFLINDTLVAAGLGYFNDATNTWLTHLTNVRNGLQNAGLGRLLRLKQINSLFHNRLKQRGPSESPLKALSLSNNVAEAGSTKTAVDFQRKFYLKTMEWTEAEPDDARAAIASMNAAEPKLNLIHTAATAPVTPLLFLDTKRRFG